ncbi:MAG: hypothetical protein R2780_12105 [Crocinitomicaceae bacterium]
MNNLLMDIMKELLSKNYFSLTQNHQELNIHMQPILSLLDVLLYKATPKQSQVLHYKLMNNSEKDISKKLRVVQSVINQHSTSVGLNYNKKVPLSIMNGY